LCLIMHVQHKLLAYLLLHCICLLPKFTYQPIEILHINQMIYNQYCKMSNDCDELSSVCEKDLPTAWPSLALPYCRSICCP
jgi:hypothetical protein